MGIKQLSETSSHRWWRLGGALAASGLAIGVSFISAPAAHAATVTFDDLALQAAVNQEMNTIDSGNRADSDPIDDSDPALTQVTRINVTGQDIQSLVGIESLTGLDTLILQSTDVDDDALEHLADHAGDLEDLELLNLSSNPGITEEGVSYIAQGSWDSLNSLSISNTGVTDADDVAEEIASGLPDLESLGLGNLPLTDTGAGAIADGLSGLESLVVSGTGITNAGVENIANSLSNLDTLWANEVPVTNSGLSAIAGLSAIKHLYLREASITDISPLSSVSTLEVLDLRDQQINLDSVGTSESFVNPVRDENGDVVPVTSSDSDFTYDGNDDSWTFDDSGPKTMEWDIIADLDGVKDFKFEDGDEVGEITFSGELFQDVALSLPEPDVTQAQCAEDGSIIAPSVDHDSNDNVSQFVYYVNDDETDDLADVAPGDDVVITAWPQEDVQLTPGNGWEFGSDGELIYTVTLDDAPDCSPEEEPTPPETEEPSTPDDDEPSTPDEGDSGDSSDKKAPESLPKTGSDVAAFIVGGIALLLAGAGVVLLGRRMKKQN